MDPLNIFRQQRFLDPALMEPPLAEKTFLQMYGEKIVGKGLRAYATKLYKCFFEEIDVSPEFISKLKRVFPRNPPLPDLEQTINQSEEPIQQPSKKEKSKEKSSTDSTEKPKKSKKPLVFLNEKEIIELGSCLDVTNAVCLFFSFFLFLVILF